MTLILLNITPFGYGIITLIIGSLIFTILGLKRLKSESKSSKKTGCIGFGYIWLVVFAVTSLTAGLSYYLVDHIYDIATLPRYEAKVIDHHTYIDTVEETDDEGYSTSYDVLMYQPEVSFIDENGEGVTILIDVSSGAPETLGTFITVGYEPGRETAVEISLGKVGLLFGAFIMLYVFGCVFYAGLSFVLGKDMAAIKNFGAFNLVWIIIPGAMLIMFSLLSYAVGAYFMGKKPDMPMWVLLICIFFVATLFFAIWGYFKMIFRRTEME